MTGPSEVFFGREAGRRAPPSVRPSSPGQALSHLPASGPALGGKYIQPTVGNGHRSAWVLGLGWVILWTTHGASLHIGFCGWRIEINIVPASELGSGTECSAGVKSMLSSGQAWPCPSSETSACSCETRNQRRRVVCELGPHFCLFPVPLGDTDNNIYSPSL